MVIEQQQNMSDYEEHGCYIYVVNNKYNMQWDQSILQLYHKDDLQRKDDIKGFFLVVCSTFWTLLLNLYFTL